MINSCLYLGVSLRKSSYLSLEITGCLACCNLALFVGSLKNGRATVRVTDLKLSTYYSVTLVIYYVDSVGNLHSILFSYRCNIRYCSAGNGNGIVRYLNEAELIKVKL